MSAGACQLSTARVSRCVAGPMCTTVVDMRDARIDKFELDWQQWRLCYFNFLDALQRHPYGHCAKCVWLRCRHAARLVIRCNNVLTWTWYLEAIEC